MRDGKLDGRYRLAVFDDADGCDRTVVFEIIIHKFVYGIDDERLDCLYNQHIEKLCKNTIFFVLCIIFAPKFFME